jgi:hypothetical protein
MPVPQSPPASQSVSSESPAAWRPGPNYRTNLPFEIQLKENKPLLGAYTDPFSNPTEPVPSVVVVTRDFVKKCG